MTCTVLCSKALFGEHNADPSQLGGEAVLEQGQEVGAREVDDSTEVAAGTPDGNTDGNAGEEHTHAEQESLDTGLRRRQPGGAGDDGGAVNG